MTTICLYINPNAPGHLRRLLEGHFPDVPRVSADEMLELNPGSSDTSRPAQIWPDPKTRGGHSLMWLEVSRARDPDRHALGVKVAGPK
jgi:hypothetical protein